MPTPPATHPPTPKHLNDGACFKCQLIFNRYPNFHPTLRTWFETLQSKVKDAHISCAGRGRAEQELYLSKGTSKASYGNSAHNYNCAIDIFRITQAGGAEWGVPWFRDNIGPAVDAFNSSRLSPQLLWYGRPMAPYFELPHIEIKDWRLLKLPLVEL